MIDLDELQRMESRVAKKFAEAAAARTPLLPDLDHLVEWFGGAAQLAPSAVQFPREQWITLPNRRLVTLMTVDRALDSELSDEQWFQVALLMQYGGRERVA